MTIKQNFGKKHQKFHCLSEMTSTKSAWETHNTAESKQIKNFFISYSKSTCFWK